MTQELTDQPVGKELESEMLLVTQESIIMQEVYCLLRNKMVAALPEELVRQKLLHEMIYQLHYPKSGLVVEKALQEMPHLSQKKAEIPSRRADIICFASGIHSNHALYPLLLVECKSIKLTREFVSQVIGYNHYIGAPYIAVTNGKETQFGWLDSKEKKYKFILYFPPYNVLMKKLQYDRTKNE